MRQTTSRPGILACTFSVVLAAAAASGARFGQAHPTCRPPPLGSAYTRRVERATSAGEDVWGNALLRAPGGASYERARRYLHPLLLAGAPGRRRLTDSGVYYLAFGQPSGPGGRGEVALHVADGSEVVSDRVDGTRLVLEVGRDGRERYGSCLARLVTPHLYGGYYPVLETAYTDAAGTRFRQESFAARVPGTASLASFLRLHVDIPAGAPAEQIRFTPSESGLTETGGRLQKGADTVLFFSTGGRFDGTSLVYRLAGPATITIARLVRPAPSEPIAVDGGAYANAKRSLLSYWDRRLAQGATFLVPDPRVLDAERNLLTQNLLMTWRYSIGNPYEAFEFPESLETATVMGEYGFADVDRAIVEESLTREPHLYPEWEAATRLLAAARYYRLFRDDWFVADETRALERNAALLERPSGGLLPKERYAADLSDVGRGFQTQAVAWQALKAVADVWQATGSRTLAARARAAAARLGVSLRTAVARSATRLPDGSLFLPERLLDHERPYGPLTKSRAGSYWNLVVPDALASGFLPGGGRDATGALRYLLEHGSRLLGLVRAGAYALYGRSPSGASGTDEVYGTNVARFLADNDRRDQLVLSLYGALAAGMTENTFVSGEAASVTPIAGGYYRSMYLPPNSTSNASFLECLRLMLVHETYGRDGRPDGLELAFSTPRAWLASGRRVVVRAAPTTFGPVSYSIEAEADTVRVRLRPPNRLSNAHLLLRLRRPAGSTITSVVVDGRRSRRFDAASATIDLTGHTGDVSVTADYTRPEPAAGRR